MAVAQTANLAGVPEYSARRIRPFTSLPDAVIKELDDVLVPAPRAVGSVLFSQNDNPSTVNLLFAGKVKLTTVVATGKTALLRIAQPGELLGLNAAMSQRPYMATARVLEDSQIASLSRDELVSLMCRHCELGIAIAERLADDCAEALTEMLFLRVTTTTLQRLAMLILRWSGSRRQELPILYTHGEIGQMIGASRETVTRLMKQLERNGNISVSRSHLRIVNARSMRKIARIR